MAEPLVVNTGPLVSFTRIGCLDVIGRKKGEQALDALCSVKLLSWGRMAASRKGWTASPASLAEWEKG